MKEGEGAENGASPCQSISLGQPYRNNYHAAPAAAPTAAASQVLPRIHYSIRFSFFTELPFTLIIIPVKAPIIDPFLRFLSFRSSMNVCILYLLASIHSQYLSIPSIYLPPMVLDPHQCLQPYLTHPSFILPAAFSHHRHHRANLHLRIPPHPSVCRPAISTSPLDRMSLRPFDNLTSDCIRRLGLTNYSTRPETCQVLLDRIKHCQCCFRCRTPASYLRASAICGD